MSAHTSGPWCLSSESPTIIKQADPFGGNDGVLIGSAAGYTGSGFFPTDEEAIANARLIAAAPDLYDAADNALGVLIGCCVAGDGIDDRKAMLDARQMLRAAINKATGRTQ
jgi:hypothetical protein